MPCQHRAQRCGLAGEFAAELEALVPDRLTLGERDFERRLAAEPWQVVVGPGDRIDADLDIEAPGHGCCLRFAATYCSRALFTLSRSETSGTATSHHHPPSVVVRAGSVSMHTTEVRSAARARLSAASSSGIVLTFSAFAPIAAACAAKSMEGGPVEVCSQSTNRLLNGSPPQACCKRLMQP